jgi:CRP-like cAMP-binding protein
MYIIVEGVVEVSTIIDNSRLVLDDLTYGSSINGEMMLFGTMMNVNATCATKVIYYEIDQKSFFSVIS